MNLKIFGVSSAVRISHPKAPKMLKVVFYRSLYTISHLFIQFFILQTNYRSAKSISCPNIVLATKYRRQKPINIYLLKHRFWLHIIKVQCFDQFNEGKLFSNHIASSVNIHNDIPF